MTKQELLKALEALPDDAQIIETFSVYEQGFAGTCVSHKEGKFNKVFDNFFQLKIGCEPYLTLERFKERVRND